MVTPPPSQAGRHDKPPEPADDQATRSKPRSRPVFAKRPMTSPFFGPPPSTSPTRRVRRKSISNSADRNQEETATPKTKIRPPRGVVSCLPIPSLSASRFGLLQEELAHDPFQLLVGITFLIRTAGKTAMPIIREFLTRFPTPESLARAKSDEIISMIHRLGLSAVRCRNLQKYARTWLEKPPTREVRYGVKNYPNPGDGARVHAGEVFGPEDGGNSDRQEDANLRGLGLAWEIGHVAEGPYAVDSWRIFCRDKLLGRAEDWLGGGREPEFQPEWMRVLPKDKELRAYLRWLWFREGWEWDPETGTRSVLRDELQKALTSRRVCYDGQGRMVIVEAPLDSRPEEDDDVADGADTGSNEVCMGDDSMLRVEEERT
ncbi:DNA glycosylase [Thozetella sp. PMI_491]|nr:DNA glycosylase [Thozetella sp. PMI_491]